MAMTVQFCHPYAQPAGLGPDFGWNRGPGPHQRKFLWLVADLWSAAGLAERDADVVCWGQWEGPSRAVEYYASTDPWAAQVLHLPLAERNPGDAAGNDPQVVGEHIVYSNCQQQSKPFLRDLQPQDLVLFGSTSTSEQAFFLDTCLVIDEAIPYVPHRSAESLPDDDVWNAITRPSLISKKHRYQEFTYYRGARPAALGVPFSFVPARRRAEGPFLRPSISLDAINPRFARGARPERRPVEVVKENWREVVRQVEAAGLLLATDLRLPAFDGVDPMLGLQEAGGLRRRRLHARPASTAC